MTTPAPARPLHPRRGTHAPVAGTPQRRPESVRRTTTIDTLRLDGLFGPLTIRALGRDLVTAADGSATEADVATISAHVAFVDGRALTDITTAPTADLSGLIGTRVASGFRAKLDATAPDLRDAHSVLYQLLDDLPGATLVSGYTLSEADVIPAAAATKFRPAADLCSGWRSGGTIMLDIERVGLAPVVTGPAAPSLVIDDDPHSWHVTESLPAQSMRRARRLDVWREPDGRIGVDSFFRDSHVDAEGRETVIHEYAVTSRVDPVSGTVVAASAVEGALPWVECPAATLSATRLAGQPVEGLRSFVRTDLTGISTCTHLNDQLRSLADVLALAALLG
jgi:hypothetical protein